MNTLDEVRKFLNSCKVIHEGGCGISALAMSRWIRKTVPEFSSEFVMTYGEEMYVENTDQNFRWRNNDVLLKERNLRELYTPLHLYVLEEITGDFAQVFDCRVEDEIPLEDCHIIDEQTLVTLLGNGDWNGEFNRMELVPEIVEELQINLFDVFPYHVYKGEISWRARKNTAHHP